MHKILVLVAVCASALATAAGASALGAQRPDGSASCTGFLANAANPNMGTLMKELVRPALDAQGLTVGDFQRDKAQEHPGVGGFQGLELCIPDF